MPLRRLRCDPALVPPSVDDGDLYVLDRDWLPVDADHTSRLTWCRAQPAGELWEVVGRVQPLQRFVPVTAPHQVVPFWNEIPQRAARVTERNAAVHATARLLGDDREHGPTWRTGIDLLPVVNPLSHWAPRRNPSRRRHKPSRISHTQLPSAGEERWWSTVWADR